MKKQVSVHLAEGFEEIEAVSIIDVLRRAEIETVVVSVTGQKEVKGAHGMIIKADELFEDINYEKCVMIVLPGGMPGSANLNDHKGLKDQITNFYKEDKLLGAICAAPLVFGHLGILHNRKATCYPGFEDQLIGALTTGSEVEISDNIITGKGPGVAIKFALGIAEMIKGKKLAEKLAHDMIVNA